MADTTVRYRPRDYRRVCDICGNLRNISDMHRQDELWVCTYDAGERVRTELDRGNARQRPFTIKPVPYPKPQDNFYPNLLETDDAAVFNFLSQQVAARCRYEKVQSGAAPYTSAGEALTGLSWAARYYYDLIQENSRRLLIDKAKTLLGTIADYITTRQRGFGLVPGVARATDPWWGGFLESGATSYITADTASCGLALLYAYRVLGTASYLAGARGAASYLRNVQAIGRYAIQHTSGNSSGTSYLYTGAVCSQVSTTVGIDPGELFYSNHLFYPGDLTTLEFWNELKLTDGDQTIGSTGTGGDAFASVPSQLLSQSITDMRDCWSTGITDKNGTLTNGLSSDSPREFFNAYPATKTGFTSVTGTGLWEYADGPSATGTQISSQNFALALSSLYNYEGASEQVTTISDWLRSFTSNEDFETSSDVSTATLYQSTTGEYDPTLTISTLLTVRDADEGYAAIQTNGSSLYDWGAFGLLSRLWASRNTGSFRQSRLYPLNTVQRYFDGNATDTATDRIILRGLSGLTLQTALSIPLDGTPVGLAIGDVLPSSDRDAQGANVEWNDGGVVLVEPGTHSRYDVTTIDEPTSDLMAFSDGAGSVCPDGGVVYIHNIAGSTITAEHMASAATATDYPFFCVGETNLSIANGDTVGFVRVSAIPAWLQLELLAVVNDAVRAAQYGRAFRESRG